MREVNDLLCLSPALRWLLVSDFGSFPGDAVARCGLVLADRRCHNVSFAKEDREMWVKGLKGKTLFVTAVCFCRLFPKVKSNLREKLAKCLWSFLIRTVLSE